MYSKIKLDQKEIKEKQIGEPSELCFCDKTGDDPLFMEVFILFSYVAQKRRGRKDESSIKVDGGDSSTRCLTMRSSPFASSPPFKRITISRVVG